MADTFTCVVDDVTYYGLVAAADGWPTGPCPSPEKARERLDAYEAGLEVSEAAPGQLSRAQLSAVLRLRHRLGPSTRERLQALADDAIASGLHSPAWARASAAAVKVWDILPDWVRHAGGARIRRAPGEVSLTRSAQDEEPAGPAGPRWR